MAEAEETKFCSNCKRDIAASNFVMHEMHCQRHIVLCQHCKEPIPRTELEQHFNDIHAKIPCEKCGQEVSKENMEKHMDSDCSKKPVECEHCDLSFPKSEITSHKEYCGSRTEPCPNCQQYIMLKDMLRHENSSCTYPEPKPAPAPQPDPFSMDDFQSMFDANHFAEPPIFQTNLRTDNLGRPTNTNEAVRSRVTAAGNRSRFTPGANVSRATGGANGSRVTAGANGSRVAGGAIGSRSSTNVLNGPSTRGSRTSPKKLDVNVQRAKNLTTDQLSPSVPDEWLNAIPPDMDYDTMLALQLAHEDWTQDDIPEATDWTRFELGDFVADGETWDLPDDTPAQPVQPVENPRADNLTAPCEFCDMEIELSNYMDHVESCLMRDSVIVPNLRNNEVPTSPPRRRSDIASIDNLRANIVPAVPNIEDDLLLPCEFCEDVFPADIIFQHQSVCQANGMVTPRLTTPVAGFRQGQGNAASASTQTTLRASPKPASVRTRQKHQGDPSLIDFVSPDDGQVRDENRDENRFRFHRVPESSSNKYSPALDRFDVAVTRPPRRASRPNEDDVAAATVGEVPRQSKSAQRTRASLNQLLQEDKVPSNPTNGTRKTTKKPVVGQNKNRTVGKERPSPVNSRQVLNELERSNERTNRARVDEPVSGARPRQRTDHVFSPELRLKPDHNPPNKKR